ncbi:MAG: hypothetical protein GYB37_03955 [Algicola sp.]|nr:hypothetical protein [Algicola sp.]
MQHNTPKLLFFLALFLCLTQISFVSCSQDEDLIDLVGLEDPDEETVDDSDGKDDEDPDNQETPDLGGTDDSPDFDSSDGLKVNNTPCDYTLNNLEANSTLEIDCQMDLEGQTITLPAGVTLLFKEGEIINGTLNFTSSGTIDGNLLNKDLNIEGDVQLNDAVFQFYPERWDIEQGQVNSDRALKNNANFEGLMFYVKELGATTFQTDRFDAYFEVTKVTSTTTNQNFYPSVEAVNIPSDFTLSMTDNTILRVYPSPTQTSAALLAIREASNVRVFGGVLYGDRDIRNYTRENAEEGAHLLSIHSGKNVVLEGIKFVKGSMGGLNIYSIGHSFQPIYNPSNNIVVKSCVFESIRRMSIALTDGYNVDINGNTFIKSGQPSTNSDGGTVGYAINLEPVRTRDSNTNELIEYQKVHDVVIRNNIERESREGALVVFVGQRILIEQNEFEKSVAYNLASDVEIKNNRFTAGPTVSKPAIITGGQGETVFNNKVTGNVIEGYGLGIAAYYKDIEIEGNTITNCDVGILLKSVEDVTIANNSIHNSSGGQGIAGQITTANNLLIQDNEIDVDNNAIYFVQLNLGSNQNNDSVIIERNDFIGNGKTTISSSSGITYRQNTSGTVIQILNSSNVEVLKNVITPANNHGVYLNGTLSGVNIYDNDISVPSNFMCIRNNASGSITLNNNSCQ